MAKVDHGAVELELREFAMSFPEVTEDFPWGHRAMKVRGKKAFVFFAHEDGVFSLTVKLPLSAGAALSLPNVQPTGYGLGKSNWVTAQWQKGERVDGAMVRSWIDESYRTVAPKKLVAQIGSR